MRGIRLAAVVVVVGASVAGAAGWGQGVGDGGAGMNGSGATATANGSSGDPASEIRQRKVIHLISDAARFYEETRYKEAADRLREATIIDPTNTQAVLMLRLVMNKITDRDPLPEMFRKAMGEENGASGGRWVPRPFEKELPLEFSVIADTRAIDRPGQISAIDRAARDRLEMNLTEIAAAARPLENVLNFLRDNMGANIFVNWPALQKSDVDRNTPVTISLKEVPFRKALTTILSQVGRSPEPGLALTYTIDDGIIVISTKDDLITEKYRVEKFYDIRDMLVGTRPVAGTMPATGPRPATALDGDEARRRVIDDLIGTITSTVAADTWQAHGGKVGTIREENGQLIVGQTKENQWLVYNVLEQLRETRSMQIVMEPRVIWVAPSVLDSFLTEWGVRGEETPGGAARNIATEALNGGARRKQANVAASVIDNWTLSLLLNATQADKESATATTPRMTLFNGGHGMLAGMKAQRYIAAYEHDSTPGAKMEYVPTEGVVKTGVSVAVEAAVTADRRTVVMELEVSKRELARMDHEAEFGVPAEKGLLIDKPVTATETKKVTVSVPDGRTVLIDFGMAPLGRGKRMLMLIRPNVIIHKEIENDLFGRGYDGATGAASGPAATRARGD